MVYHSSLSRNQESNLLETASGKQSKLWIFFSTDGSEYLTSRGILKVSCCCYCCVCSWKFSNRFPVSWGLPTMSNQLLSSVFLGFWFLSLKGLEFLLKEVRTTRHRKHHNSLKKLLFVLICVQLIFDYLPFSFPFKIKSRNPTECVG